MPISNTAIKAILRYPTVIYTGNNGNLYLGTLLASNAVIVGNSSVNAVLNSTSISVTSLLANGSLGSSGDVLYSNGTGLYWGNPPGGGGVSGSNTEIQFNDSGAFGSSNGFTFNNSTNLLTLGNTSVNTQINSTSVVLKSLVANGSSGSNGDVLYSNGTGLYWAAPTGGGGGLIAGDGLSSNTTHYSVLANSGIVANNTGTFVNSSYIATLDSNNATNLNGQPASFYTNATNFNAGTLDYSRLPANVVIWSNTNTFTSLQTFEGNLSVGNSSVNVSINSTSFSGTANNALNLNGIPSANYALLSSGTATFTGNIVANNANTTNNLNVGGNLTVSGNVFINGGVVSLLGNTTTFVDNMLFLNQGISANITNISGSGTIVTFTANNNYQVGWDVIVSGVNPSSYNGTYFNITAANATHFQVSNTNTASYISGGIARGRTDLNPDIGLTAGYNDGTYHHTGIFRDASDGYWKVFEGYDPEPDTSIFIDTSDPSFIIANFQAGTLRLGNTTVYGTVNTTIYTGTANNADNLGGISLGTLQGQITGNAATAFSNAIANAAASAAATYQTSAGLAANVVQLTANDSTNFNGQPASFYANGSNITTGTVAAARLPANLVFWSNTNTFSAVQTFNANVFVNTATQLLIGNATVNAVANQTTLFVANSTTNISVNPGIITFGGGATVNNTIYSGTANNATNLGGVAAASYVNTSAAYTITGVHVHNANVIVNTAVLSVGNTTANVTTNTTHIVVGNSSVNVSINSTAFSGTSSNATNLNSQPGSYYTNATNLATGTVPTARLATSGTANSSTFLRGDQTWATPAGGGSGTPGGATTDIQFNDSGNFAGNANFTYDSSAVRLTVGNTTVNTQVNSTAVVVKSIVANGSTGSSGQFLTSNGTGIYWSTASGGGGGGEVVSSVSSNTNMAAPTTFYLVSGNVTMTLPTSVGNSGLKFQVKNNGTGTITIDTTSSQTIDGNINMLVTEQNSVIGLIADGSNWNIF